MVGRRVGAWVVAAAVTVALVAGAVWVAGGGPDRSPAVLPALDLGAAAADTATADNAGASVAAEPAPAPAGVGAEPAPKGGATIPRIWPPVTYRLKGPLPDLPDRARAWKVGADPGDGRVVTLAAALGLAGTPKEDPSGWTVRDGNRSLTVNRLAGAPWTYGTGVLGACVARVGGPRRPGAGIQCLDPDAPVSNKPGTAPAAGAGSASGSAGAAGAGSAPDPGNAGGVSGGRPVPPVTVRPVAPVRPFRPADVPSREQAERVARDLAAKAGLDIDGAAVRITDAYAARLVTIAPAVGGLPTAGFSLTVTVGAKGRVQHASGYLATPEPADTYPLIGVEEGYERLKRTPPLGPLLRAQAPAREVNPCPAGAEVPCAARPLPARVATVTGARLGLQLAPTLATSGRPGGLAYLLPAYLFDLEGGWTDVRPIIAVQDRYLTR
jgi:hypothetical protein